VAFWLSLLLSLQSPLLELVHDVVPGYRTFRLPGRMLFVSAVIGTVLFACAVELWLRQKAERLARVVVVGLAVALLLEGAVHAQRYLKTVPEAQVLPAADHPAHGLELANEARVAVVGRNTFNYGWAQPLGLRLVNGYGPYSFAHYKRYLDMAAFGAWREAPLGNWFDLPSVARPDLLAEVGVQVVLSKSALHAPELEPIARHEAVDNFVFYRGLRRQPLHLYRLRGPRSWARFASAVTGAPSEAAMADAVQRAPLTGQAIALGLSTEQASALGGADGTVVVERSSSGHARLRTRRREPGLLVVAESWHPGWRALVDGARAPVHQVNVALLGVRVPQGEHLVELRFVPLRFELGTRLSVAAVLLLLLLALAALRRRVKASSHRPAAATRP
jgi:hypothetical protein